MKKAFCLGCFSARKECKQTEDLKESVQKSSSIVITNDLNTTSCKTNVPHSTNPDQFPRTNSYTCSINKAFRLGCFGARKECKQMEDLKESVQKSSLRVITSDLNTLPKVGWKEERPQECGSPYSAFKEKSGTPPMVSQQHHDSQNLATKVWLFLVFTDLA